MFVQSTISCDVFLLVHPEGKSKKEKGAPIQRSTETGMAVELTRNMSRQPSRESNNGSMNSYNSEGKSVNPSFPVLISISTLLACLLSHHEVCSVSSAFRHRVSLNDFSLLLQMDFSPLFTLL